MLIAQLKNKVGYLVIVGCIQFFVLTIIAMFTYAGGTFYNPGGVGYSFFNNFFSELGGLTNHEGDSNIISAVLFIFSLSFMGLSIIPFFLMFQKYFHQNIKLKILSKAGTIVGIFSAIFYIGIACTPYDILIVPHIIFVQLAFNSALIFVILYMIAIFLKKSYPNFYAYLYLIFSVELFLYIILLLSGTGLGSTNDIYIQATGQKIIVYSEIICLLIQGYGFQKYINSEVNT